MAITPKEGGFILSESWLICLMELVRQTGVVVIEVAVILSTGLSVESPLLIRRLLKLARRSIIKKLRVVTRLIVVISLREIAISVCHGRL